MNPPKPRYIASSLIGFAIGWATCALNDQLASRVDPPTTTIALESPSNHPTLDPALDPVRDNLTVTLHHRVYTNWVDLVWTLGSEYRQAMAVSTSTVARVELEDGRSAETEIHGNAFVTGAYRVLEGNPFVHYHGTNRPRVIKVIE